MFLIYFLCFYFAFAGLLIAAFLLPIEYVGRQWRTFSGCVGTWAIGVATLALVAYFVRDWKQLCLATSCAGIPLLISWWYVDFTMNSTINFYVYW